MECLLSSRVLPGLSGCLLLDRLLEEDVVLLIRSESELNISIIRTISESPINLVIVNQDVLSAWGIYSEISGVRVCFIYYSIYRILSRSVDMFVNLLPYFLSHLHVFWQIIIFQQ